MDLRHLQCFVAVAEERSLTAAARRLRHTPEQVSTDIISLEGDLGVELLERPQEHGVLTAAGHRFLDRARAMLRLADASP